jgi:hypothetical protein
MATSGNKLKPENVENVWTVNLTKGYTRRNAARLRNLELKQRFVNYAKIFPELKQNRNVKGEQRNAMNMFTKKNNRRRRIRSNR